MATKKELVAALVALAIVPAADAEAFEGDNTHDELTAMLKAAEANAEAAKTAPPPVVEVYEVCEGKAVTTIKRGIMSEGDEVTAADFGGGNEALDALYQKNVVKVK